MSYCVRKVVRLIGLSRLTARFIERLPIDIPMTVTSRLTKLIERRLQLLSKRVIRLARHVGIRATSKHSRWTQRFPRDHHNAMDDGKQCRCERST